MPLIYPLEELSNAGYRQRTIKNIEDSDGTAIFYFGRPTGGTELTLIQCIRLHKPYQLVDAAEIEPSRAGEILLSFTKQYEIAVLNVAGPSEGRTPGTHAYVHKAARSLIEAYRVGA